jgi:hypothetical protein
MGLAAGQDLELATPRKARAVLKDRELLADLPKDADGNVSPSWKRFIQYTDMF